MSEKCFETMSVRVACRTRANEVQAEVIQELVDDLFEKMASGSAAWFQSCLLHDCIEATMKSLAALAGRLAKLNHDFVPTLGCYSFPVCFS